MKNPTSVSTSPPPAIAALLVLLLLIIEPDLAHAAPPASAFQSNNPFVEYFLDWFPRVTRIQSEQPHWATPLVTVSPRLLEQYRYDQFFQSQPHGTTIDNFGGGKGLELIPFQNTEVILGQPAWIAHNGKIIHGTKNTTAPSDGWADETFLVKYRLVSANEEKGNYILTVFMGFSAPTGDATNSNGHAVFTPTIAAGKGWGNFIVQSTLGVSFPDGGEDRLGMPLAFNTAFQYHIFKYLWPEIEVNHTWWPNGGSTGENQVFLTPGLVIGQIPIRDRIGLALGAGYQVAVTHQPAYNHSVIVSGRVPF